MFKERCKQKINEFKTLKANWNDNEALPINEFAIKNALFLLQYLIYEPEIYPLPNGGIQFEYENQDSEYYEIEIYSNRYETFKINRNKEEKEKVYELNEYFKILNHIKTLFNGIAQNVVLFTGSFNPPTIAHNIMIDSVLKTKKFDYVFFALSNEKFLSRKQSKTKDWYYSEQDRINMVVEMTYQNPKVLILGVEQGYTYDTLVKVRDDYNCESVYFACGSDKLKEIGRWGRANNLLTEFCFYILERTENLDEIKSICDELFKNTQYLIGQDNIKYRDISATKVRNNIKNNISAQNMLHINVYKYIKKLEERG